MQSLPPELLASWYAKLPHGSNIERPDGRLRSDFAQRNGSRLVEVAGGTPVSSEHNKLGAAVYRYSLAQRRPRGGKGRGPGRPGVPTWKRRRILALLAAGLAHKKIAAKVHVSEREVVTIRGEVRRWVDPDAE